MKQKFYPPRKNYIVFEMIRINTKLYIKNPDAPDAFSQEDVVYLGVMPEGISYQLMSRNYRIQTTDLISITKYSLQPEKCNLNGYFGEDRRLIAGTYMSGFERLKYFRDNVVTLSKLINPDDSMYFLNYYDFNFQKYGSIDIDSFSLTGNARSHSIMPRYSLDFTIVGELLTPVTSSDKLLNWLKATYLPGGTYDDLLANLSFTIPEGVTDVFTHATALKECADVAKDAKRTITNVAGCIGNIAKTDNPVNLIF
ncbi:MAG: hypothetical protein LCH52_08225 [Bacteroidetes bacterium]|nr:hypothetical protein [Bacteroidota bacterium]